MNSDFNSANSSINLVDKNSTQFWIFFGFMILVLLIPIIYTFAVMYYIRENKCFNNTLAPWCFDDWKCYNDFGEEVNMSERVLLGKYGTSVACTPLTDGSPGPDGQPTPDSLHSFPYINTAGSEVVGNPSQEKNIWDPVCANDTSKMSCGNYTLGDVYWKACHGAPGTPYYTPS